MYSDEALSSFKPHNKLKKYKFCRKYKSMSPILFKAFLFIISLLIISNIAVCFLYRNVKTYYKNYNDKISVINQQSATLTQQRDMLAEENSVLRQDCERLRAENEKILKELDEIKKQNNEIMQKNQELIEDNIALQNSLKMAASAGIKPQNYTKFTGLTSRTDIERGIYLGSFLGTAYTPSKEECGNDEGITNSGKPIIPGVSIAVDNRYWPFGTIFYIKGLGYAVAMDTGASIKGRNRFDFAVFDKKFANILGKKYWEVYLVRIGNGNVEDIKF